MPRMSVRGSQSKGWLSVVGRQGCMGGGGTPHIWRYIVACDRCGMSDSLIEIMELNASGQHERKSQ